MKNNIYEIFKWAIMFLGYSSLTFLIIINIIKIINGEVFLGFINLLISVTFFTLGIWCSVFIHNEKGNRKILRMPFPIFSLISISFICGISLLFTSFYSLKNFELSTSVGLMSSGLVLTTTTTFSSISYWQKEKQNDHDNFIKRLELIIIELNFLEKTSNNEERKKINKIFELVASVKEYDIAWNKKELSKIEKELLLLIRKR